MEKFRNKWILIDTNLLIELSRDVNSGFFDVFLSDLQKFDIQPVVEQSVLFEYRRGSRTPRNLSLKNEFLSMLIGDSSGNVSSKNFSNLPIRIEDAEKLAILYSHKDVNLSRISFIDCLVAAQLKQYKDNMCLATLDHSDFPDFVFDRYKIYTIDTGKKIINIGIYVFNQEKYEELQSDFEGIS